MYAAHADPRALIDVGDLASENGRFMTKEGGKAVLSALYLDCIDLEGVGDAVYRSCFDAASAERRQRAARCRNAEDAARCILADALLRRALVQCGFTDPPELAQSVHGKPFVRNADGFHYNLSHSGKWVVIGYGGAPLGVDVERIDSDRDHTALARRYFTADENTFLLAAPDPGERALRFTRIWTAKESYIKYLGTGLATPLPAFSVHPVRGCVRDSAASTEGLALHSFSLDAAYWITVCTHARGIDFRVLTEEDLVW